MEKIDKLTDEQYQQNGGLNGRNKMMDKIIYLCGPINGCTDEECKDWREFAKLKLLYPVLDPMRRDYRGIEVDCSSEIVEGDKFDLDSSSHLLVNYEKPSVGTSMEI